ncbi:MAG: hypothetical protein JXQ75_15180 [Phycisphaerae bacterium]|nr:hypothetical protein [Phycisphaerae bacterium]
MALTCWPSFLNPQLDPDDYRYLRLVQALDADFSGNILDASIVENRWDHLWWLDAEQEVRFFRPTVVLSYWLDTKLYGDGIVVGLLVTNVLLHFACALLAYVLLVRWVGIGLPALVGGALFAAFACHGGVIWYIAGRTDTLAALGFLGGLALHVSGQQRANLRWLALGCYAFAFVTKELAISLPVLCFLHDHLVEGRGGGVKGLLRKEWRLYTGYVAIALVVQGVRAVALSDGGPSLVHPYFTSPLSTEFPMHVLYQFWSYGENLLLARWTKPFMTPAEVWRYHSLGGLALILAVLAPVVILSFRDRRFLLFSVLGLLTWLPVSFVYLSERYLYLPSLAVAGTLALTLARLRLHKARFVLGLLVAAIWIGHQGYSLALKNRAISGLTRGPTSMQRQLAQLEPGIPKGAKVLILNLPGDWLQAQFTEDQLRVQLGDPTLSVRVLTVMPSDDPMGSGMEVRRDGENAVVVGGRPREQGGRCPLMEEGAEPFPWIELETGRKVTGARLGFEVEILDGRGDRCDELRFVLPEPLEHYTILQWHADPDGRGHPAHRRNRGWAEFVRI